MIDRERRVTGREGRHEGRAPGTRGTRAAIPPRFAALLAVLAACGGAAAGRGAGAGVEARADAAADDDGADADTGILASISPDAGLIELLADPLEAPPKGATGCPKRLDAPHAGPCAIGATCKVPGGTCTCEGWRGGVPPPPGDASAWVCGRTHGRADGCPDDLRAGRPCTEEARTCPAREGTSCGPRLACRAGRWVDDVDTCRTLPGARPL